MANATHLFRESGNGFPRDGSLVIEADDHGWHKLLRVVAAGGDIETHGMGQANTCALICEPADQDWGDLDDAEADRLYDELPHVAPIN